MKKMTLPKQRLTLDKHKTKKWLKQMIGKISEIKVF